MGNLVRGSRLPYLGRTLTLFLFFILLLVIGWTRERAYAGAGAVGEGNPPCPAQFQCYGQCGLGLNEIVGNADSFVTGPSMSTARASFASTALQLVGGVPSSVGNTTNCDTALASFRFGLVAGGIDGQGNVVSSAELFGPLVPGTNNQGSRPTELNYLGFAPTNAMTTPRVMHQATLFAFSFAAGTDRFSAVAKALITGGSLDLTTGRRHTSALSSSEIYTFTAGWPLSNTNPSPTGQFTATSTPMNEPRTLHQATLLSNGKVLITGGLNNKRQALATAELYDPATGKFTLTRHRMKHARFAHTATLLPDGTVLIAGGETNAASYPNLSKQSFRAAEVYNPTSDSFREIRAMKLARAGHTASLISCPSLLEGCNQNAVLITGGINGTGITPSAEVYVPTGVGVGFFSKVGNMTTPRFLHTASLIAESGQILIAGGSADPKLQTGLSSAELFDPTKSVFVATSDTMSNPRRSFSTGTTTPPINLYDVVILSGGADGTGKSQSNTDYYLPSASPPPQ